MTNQQLAETCRDILAEADKHESWCVEMAKALLPCLEAEPTYVRLFGHYGYGDRHWVECGKSEDGAQPFYTTPPVPAMKPIDLSACKRVWYEHDDLSRELVCIPVSEIKKAIRAAGYKVKS